MILIIIKSIKKGYDIDNEDNDNNSECKWWWYKMCNVCYIRLKELLNEKKNPDRKQKEKEINGKYFVSSEINSIVNY